MKNTHFYRRVLVGSTIFMLMLSVFVINVSEGAISINDGYAVEFDIPDSTACHMSTTFGPTSISATAIMNFTSRIKIFADGTTSASSSDYFTIKADSNGQVHLLPTLEFRHASNGTKIVTALYGNGVTDQTQLNITVAFDWADSVYHTYKIRRDRGTGLTTLYIDNVNRTSRTSTGSGTIQLGKIQLGDLDGHSPRMKYTVDYTQFLSGTSEIFIDNFQDLYAYTWTKTCASGTILTKPQGDKKVSIISSLVLRDNDFAGRESFNRGENFLLMGVLMGDNDGGIAIAPIELQIKKNSTGDWLTFATVWTDTTGLFISKKYAFTDTYSGAQLFRAVFRGSSLYANSTSVAKSIQVLTSSADYRLVLDRVGTQYTVNTPFNLQGYLYVKQAGAVAEQVIVDKAVSIWITYPTGRNWVELPTQYSPVYTGRDGKFLIDRLKLGSTGSYVFKANVSFPNSVNIQSANLSITIVGALDRSGLVNNAPITVIDYVEKWKSDTQIEGDGAGFFVGLIVLLFANIMLLKGGVTSVPLLAINIFMSFGLVALNIFPVWVGLLTFLMLAIYAVGPLKRAFGG